MATYTLRNPSCKLDEGGGVYCPGAEGDGELRGKRGVHRVDDEVFQ